MGLGLLKLFLVNEVVVPMEGSLIAETFESAAGVQGGCTSAAMTAMGLLISFQRYEAGWVVACAWDNC